MEQTERPVWPIPAVQLSPKLTFDTPQRYSRKHGLAQPATDFLLNCLGREQVSQHCSLHRYEELLLFIARKTGIVTGVNQ